RGQTAEMDINKVDEEVQVKEARVPLVISVREFAGLLKLPVNKVLVELMKNGVLISMNEKIDFDTASIIGEGLGYKIIENETRPENDHILQAQEKLKTILQEKGEGLKPRSPVIVVMGHVDHGKTKILDSIRKTDVVSRESGGITQHIGAYQVTFRPLGEKSSRPEGGIPHAKDEQPPSPAGGISPVKDERPAPPTGGISPRQLAGRDDFSTYRKITFIDTPGHEAFTAMRSRGAKVADIAILVIAADDGIKPQTKEAIKIIQDARLPFVVAINKIDKPEANIEKVKQELAQLNLLPEDWGGKVICVPVSAKEGTGLEDLLETVLLVADLEKDGLMADPNRLAIGTIIESHVDKGEGPVATILVQAGTLRVGDPLAMGNDFYGKVRALKDYLGNLAESALPGTPVRILGLKAVPEVGSVMEVVGVGQVENLNKNIRKHKSKQDFSLRINGQNEEEGKVKFINLIIKTDVLGSLGAIIESLIKLETVEIKIKIIGKGLGLITESDVLKAKATGAKILGFHVKPMPAVADLARDKKVAIKFYEVIYNLIEDIKKEMENLKEKEMARKLIGKLEVLKIFRQESGSMIIGGRVSEGALEVSDTVIVIRGGEPVASGKVNRLECSRQLIEAVGSGQECGINFEGEPIIQEGDTLEFYQKI
ncbi:translation initiation factor IF-2, partial [Candidatus Falkowbacteria bacterium]|nr:translation initiation factor IF-2 [Candidatus Falkowbacteria bacterium]